MVILQGVSMVSHEDLSNLFDAKHAEMFSQNIQNELISNLEYFIECLIIEFEKNLNNEDENALDENSLVADLSKKMKD